MPETLLPQFADQLDAHPVITRERLLASIRARECKVSIQDLWNDRLTSLVEQGLEYVILCAEGVSRSKVVASCLVNNHKVPAVFFEGGLRGIRSSEEAHEITQYLSYLHSKLKFVVILVHEENGIYSPTLQVLRSKVYSSTYAAITSILSAKTK